MESPKSERAIPGFIWFALVLLLSFWGWSASGLPNRPLVTLFVVLGVTEIFRKLLTRERRERE